MAPPSLTWISSLVHLFCSVHQGQTSIAKKNLEHTGDLRYSKKWVESVKQIFTYSSKGTLKHGWHLACSLTQVISNVFLREERKIPSMWVYQRPLKGLNTLLILRLICNQIFKRFGQLFSPPITSSNKNIHSDRQYIHSTTSGHKITVCVNAFEL